MRPLRRLLLVAFVLGVSAPTTGQAAVVVRNVNLREDPPSSFHPKRLLLPGMALTLVSPDPVQRYSEVRTPAGETGWVWANNIEIDDAGAEPIATDTTTSAALRALPACTIPDTDESRWGQKTRDRPTGHTEVEKTVAGMLNWCLPDDLPPEGRRTGEPLGLEWYERVYAPTGFVRLVKLLQNDSDFHVEVAASRDEDAPRVIVEIPPKYAETQSELMRLVGMQSGSGVDVRAPCWQPRESGSLRMGRRS